LIGEIAQSSREQATGLSEVNVAVNQMDQVTQQNAAMVEQATAASASLRTEATALERLIAMFRVSGAAGSSTRSHPNAEAGRPSAARPKATLARPVMRGNIAIATDDWQDF